MSIIGLISKRKETVLQIDIGNILEVKQLLHRVENCQPNEYLYAFVTLEKFRVKILSVIQKSETEYLKQAINRICNRIVAMTKRRGRYDCFVLFATIDVHGYYLVTTWGAIDSYR